MEGDVSYLLKTDDEIIRDLAKKFDEFRRYKKIKDEDLAKKGGTSRVLINKFRNDHGGISLKTFIRLLRGLGELEKLERFLEIPNQYSPTGGNMDIPEHRVRDRKKDYSGFEWGEDK